MGRDLYYCFTNGDNEQLQDELPKFYVSRRGVPLPEEQLLTRD